MNSFFTGAERTFSAEGINPNLLRGVKLFVFSIFSIHWLACFVYAVAVGDSNAHDSVDAWIGVPDYLERGPSLR